MKVLETPLEGGYLHMSLSLVGLGATELLKF